MFNHLQTFPNLCENLYLMLLISFKNLEVLEGKPIKSIWIMPHLKLSKNMLLGQFFLKTNKNCNSYGLMKIWSTFTIQKSLTIKWLNFSKKIFFIWIYHLVLHYILSSNNKFEMWINIKFSILWCSSQMNSL
jgi:hypothetical protein